MFLWQCLHEQNSYFRVPLTLLWLCSMMLFNRWSKESKLSHFRAPNLAICPLFRMSLCRWHSLRCYMEGGIKQAQCSGYMYARKTQIRMRGMCEYINSAISGWDDSCCSWWCMHAFFSFVSGNGVFSEEERETTPPQKSILNAYIL